MQANTKTLLVAALTGYGLEEHSQRAGSAAFDEHFVKPRKMEASYVISGFESPPLAACPRQHERLR
jgi:hypothetical protein